MTSRYLLFLCLAGLWACQTPPPASSPPNVLLIMTDDQGYGDLSLYENDSIFTPTLDRLSGEGMRLESFYVTPLCAPTRASLLTGRYHLRTGTFWVTKGTENMRTEETTLAEMFGEAGYATGIFGKWHNGAHYPQDPIGQGFDEFVGFSSGHWTNYFDSPLKYQDQMKPTQGFITDVLTDEAISFIQRKKDQPFFCYLPYNAPHGPFQVPDAYFDRYKALGMTDRNAAIYGMVENVDDNVGRLLATLDSLQLAENTIVVFLTDNGPNGNRYNGGMRGWKASVHEGGHRVPCFVRWPGKVAAGSVNHELTAVMDLMPTLRGLTGIAEGKHLPWDGIDLSAMLLGDSLALPDRPLFTHVSRKANLKPYPGSMRQGQFRMLINDQNQTELYDIVADPAEEINLADSLPNRTAEMQKAYEAWFQSCDYQPTGGIPLGYAEAPVVELAAHEARISGDIHFLANPNGWAHDWLVNWSSPEDTIQWDLEVRTAGNYEVSLRYSCKEEDLGAEISVEVGQERILFTLEEAFYPKKVPNPDRVPGRQEALEQSWREVRLGPINLREGAQNLKLTATRVPGTEAAVVKALILKPMPES
ncbi:MAG: arylsulfatase [Bacteroidota bacterium]